MEFIQLNEFTINIGLKNEYRIIHFSDSHAIDYKDTDPSDIIEQSKKLETSWIKVKQDFANYYHESYGDEHLIPSKEILNKIVDYINYEKPNGVVMSGDIIDFYSESNYDLLMEACGNMNYPFVYACGNHETPVDRYKDITCNKNGVMVLEFNDFKIISLDDSKLSVTSGTLNEIKTELKDKKPIIIAMHIPVMTKYNYDILKDRGEYFRIDYNTCDDVTKEFIDILIENDLIKAILCGHVHGQIECEYAPNKKQYCASSALIGKVNKITIK